MGMGPRRTGDRDWRRRPPTEGFMGDWGLGISRGGGRDGAEEKYLPSGKRLRVSSKRLMARLKKLVVQRNMRSPCEGPLLLILVFTLFCYSFARDIISPGQPLAYGDKLVSAGGTFALGFFSPKNTTNNYIGIWHNSISDQIVVWVANRQSPIISNATRLTISPSGALAITDDNSTVIWSVASTTVGNPIAQLLDTGNFVIWDAESNGVNSSRWQSFDYPTDTQLPGMKLGWDLKAGRSINLTSWKSESDPSPGPFCLTMDKSGGHELTQLHGSKIDWRSGMWNGIQFNTGIDLKTLSDHKLTFVNNTDEVYVSYQMADSSMLVRIVMNYTGHMDHYLWVNNYNSWILILSRPSGQCSPYNICGPYGYCDSGALPVCQCFDGFVPKSPGDWVVTNTSAGCTRKNPLACSNGTDGFMKMSNMVLPDTLTAKIDSSMNLDECRATCSRNCLCTGYANSDVRVGGSGCVMWGAELNNMQHVQKAGQDLYIRRSDIGKGSSVNNLNKQRQTTIAVMVSLILGSLLLSCIIYFVWRKKKTIRKESWNEDEGLELPLLPLYDLDIVIAATDNFSTKNKLGEGGFGTVYKGKLPGGQEIAVKRLSKTSKQGVDEFKNEVLLIAKLQHRNLVRLLGSCTRGEDRMLIYEYMPNKSLDAFLFDKTESIKLGWRMRFSIIIGIARGLLYLHQDSRFRIIHRDLKASNVLLDEEMNPKISDFGLARIFGTEEATARTRRVIGTYGYMSPEYAMDGIFSVKSDVFSFGVLVLEIVSGRRTKAVYLSEPEDNLLRKAWRLWSEGKGSELIDPAIGSDLSVDEIIRCIKVGLLCVQENPKARPKMSLVVHMLSDHEGASIFEPQQPGFMARSDLSFPSSFLPNQASPSINDITISLDVGR